MGSHRAEKTRRPRRRIVVLGLTLTLALGLVAVGSYAFWDRFRSTHGSVNAASVGTTQRLDEREVPLSTCRAESDAPEQISLGALRVSGCVQPVGLDGRQVEAPGNIHVAGWLESSAKPGSSGLAIIDGHSSGRFKDGIFNRLGELEPGSLFTVTLGDGSVKRFEVTSVALHSVADTMTSLEKDAKKQSSNLALITCGGAYDATDHTYAKRVVVLAQNAPDDA